jgi:DNA polymerase-3 subunit epsilon
MREVILDTETTGLKPEDGNRVIEIGCIELIDRHLTENTFHCYLNPDRDIEGGAFKVHGLSRSFLSDKQRFPDIRHELLDFIGDATMVIHNAPFDLAFLDAEFLRIDKSKKNPLLKNKVIDSLVLARKLHPGQRNSLDALSKRYEINSYDRSLHGALLDARILADVYLRMTGGQVNLSLSSSDGSARDEERSHDMSPYSPKAKLILKRASESEVGLHEKWNKSYLKI